MKRIQHINTFFLILCLLSWLSDSCTIFGKKVSKKKAEIKIEHILHDIQDEDLKDFLQNPSEYPNVDPDIWMNKALEEPAHQFLIIQYLASKKVINKGFSWLSYFENQLNIEFPLHKAVSLGLTDVILFLLDQGVVRYDANDMMILAIRTLNPEIVKILLEKGIFSDKKLYGKQPSLLPRIIPIIIFCLIIPAMILIAEKYQGPLRFSAQVFQMIFKYGIYVSFGVALLILLLQLLFLGTGEHTEGTGYLHLVAATKIHTDTGAEDPEKARNTIAIARLLVQHGARIDQKGNYVHEALANQVRKSYNCTPLHIAVKNGNLPLTIFLIRFGANVNAIEQIRLIELDGSEGELEEDGVVLYQPLFGLGRPQGKLISISTPLDYAKKLAREGKPKIYSYLRKKQPQAKHYKDLFNFLT